MKKLIVLLLAFILLLSAFGCDNPNEAEDHQNQAKNYTAVKSALFDQIEPFGYVSTEIYNFYNEEQYSSSEPEEGKEITFELLGKTITAFYKGKNKYQRIKTYPEYRYDDSDNNEYYFDPDGMLVRYYRAGSQAVEKALSEEECLNIAVEFVSSILWDSRLIGTVKLSSFKLETTRSDDGYVFEFKKYCGSLETTEYIRVTVMLDGTLKSYNSSMIDRVNWEENDIDLDAVKAAANKLVTEKMYAQTIQKYRTELIFDKFIVTTTDTGKLGVLVEATFNVYYGDKARPDSLSQEFMVFESE